jgi:predicted DNA-binding ribbon-helix-helix protein
MSTHSASRSHNVLTFEKGLAPSSLISRNIRVSDHRTSIRLEPEMWEALNEICERQNMRMNDLCTIVSQNKKEHASLTAAIRVFIMRYFRSASTEDGHENAGHLCRGAQSTASAPHIIAGTSLSVKHASQV